MTEPLAIILAPDLVSVDPQSVLNAALYFDVVYADCYTLSSRHGSDDPVVSALDDGIALSIDSHFGEGSFANLREAQILRRPPDADRLEWPAVDMGGELPEELQELVSKSIRDGAVLTVIEWTINAILSARRERPRSPDKSARGGALRLKLPATFDINNLRTEEHALTRELAISIQLATMLNTLQVSGTCAATPFFDTRANAALAHMVAIQFPVIAAALNQHRVQTLPGKHAALAATIFNDTLLHVKVRDETDILHLRELLAPELFAFRAEVSRLAGLIKSHPSDTGFLEEAEIVIANSIRPQLAAIERRLAKPSQRMLRHLVSDWKSISAVSLLPFSASLLQGADIAWATLAGACAGLGLGAIRTKLEEWSVKNESTLTFLVEVRRRYKRRKGSDRAPP